MRKLVKVFGGLLALLAIIGIILFAIGYFQKKGAGILIETSPTSTVYINDEQVGRTPYESIRESGEVVVKLLPDSFEKPLAPYETKITLASNVQTVLKRDFGETEDLSGGAIVSFEKLGSGETSISVISSPDAAEVSVDGSVKGFTPYKTSSILPGNHQLTLSAPGFEEKTISIVIQEGYKLTAQVQLTPLQEVLSKTSEEESSEPEISEVEEKEEIEILNTGTGFLRVRSGPSTSEAEIATVTPGEKYALVDEDMASSWFKIEYKKAENGEDAKVGWVSSQFSKKVDKASGSPTPSPSANPQ